VPVHPWSKTRSAIPLRRQEVLGRTLAVAVVLDDVEAELLTLDNSAHTSALNGGDMDEDVRLAVALLDKAKALGGIEKLHGSSIHDDFLSIAHRKLLAVQGARHAVSSMLREEDRRRRSLRQKQSSTAKTDVLNVGEDSVRNKPRTKIKFAPSSDGADHAGDDRRGAR